MNPQSAIHNPQSFKPVIGLLGGVGSGKSTVASEFVALGCLRVDADAIGHDMLDEPSVREWLGDRWGEGVFDADGNPDRRAIAERVFHDSDGREALNSLLHPRIRRRVEDEIAAAMSDDSVPAVVLEAPLLLEAGWEDLCTCLVFVEAPGEVRLRRVAESRGWDERGWRAREKAQFSLDMKRSKCEYTVDNSSNASHLREQIRPLFDEIMHAADRSR